MPAVLLQSHVQDLGLDAVHPMHCLNIYTYKYNYKYNCSHTVKQIIYKDWQLCIRKNSLGTAKSARLKL